LLGIHDGFDTGDFVGTHFHSLKTDDLHHFFLSHAGFELLLSVSPEQGLP
jgi:hypothetical protein